MNGNEISAPRGLTAADVTARQASGLGNRAGAASSRTLVSILSANFFSGFSLIIYALGAALFALGLTGDALLSVSVILLNGIIGAIQEVRAKRKLDHIALLSRPRVRVLRDATIQAVSVEDVVQGDTIRVEPGDQIAADGAITAGSMEMDESLLTGESRRVPKAPGELVRSGSFCVRGAAWMTAETVGASSYINKMAVAAKSFRTVVTPLQQEINGVARLMIFIAFSLGLLTLFAALARRLEVRETVQAMAVIAGVVPLGLLQSILAAYLLGAVRIANKGVLVQQANAVESMSAVNVLCMDKTGTLTSNHLVLSRMIPVVPGIEPALGDFAASVDVQNRTVEAIAKAFAGTVRTPLTEIPLSSEYKWSGLAFDEADRRGSYILGAPEVLTPFLAKNGAVPAEAAEWARQGTRVVFFAFSPDPSDLRNSGENAHLPPGLVLQAVLGFADELRPHVRETMARFVAAGVTPKIISGDAPETAAAIAGQVGLGTDLRIISGIDLAQMDDRSFAQAAAETTVFGRVTPEQKERLVAALKKQGGYVAMIGDGVNDILALKQANLGIVLESGSAAARSVADIILLGDSFMGLPFAVQEGRRVVNGMQSVLSLYLTRGLLTALLILTAGYLGIGFPFAPRQASILSVLTVGLPAFGLILWAAPTPPDRPMSLMLRRFVLPAALTITLFGLFTYMLFFYLKMRTIGGQEITQTLVDEYRKWAEFRDDAAIDRIGWKLATATARAGLMHFTVIAGLFLLFFIEPPAAFFRHGFSRNTEGFQRKPALLACCVALLYGLALTLPPVRHLLQFPGYPPQATAVLFTALAIWAFALHLMLRWPLLEKIWKS